MLRNGNLESMILHLGIHNYWNKSFRQPQMNATHFDLNLMIQNVKSKFKLLVSIPSNTILKMQEKILNVNKLELNNSLKRLRQQIEHINSLAKFVEWKIYFNNPDYDKLNSVKSMLLNWMR